MSLRKASPTGSQSEALPISKMMVVTSDKKMLRQAHVKPIKSGKLAAKAVNLPVRTRTALMQDASDFAKKAPKLTVMTNAVKLIGNYDRTESDLFELLQNLSKINKTQQITGYIKLLKE